MFSCFDNFERSQNNCHFPHWSLNLLLSSCPDSKAHGGVASLWASGKLTWHLKMDHWTEGIGQQRWKNAPEKQIVICWKWNANGM